MQVMYKLSSNPIYAFNVAFILEFEQKECIQCTRNYHDIIKSWWGHPKRFRIVAHVIYSTTYLEDPMVYFAMMLCRLFEKKSPMHFSVEWVSIMNEVAEGFTFNWAKMFSDNLAKVIAEYKISKSKGQPAPLYMSAYIMDTIYFMMPFPLMNWSWTPASAKPIHFYHSKLWE
jgi:hypothetical protein